MWSNLILMSSVVIIDYFLVYLDVFLILFNLTITSVRLHIFIKKKNLLLSVSSTVPGFCHTFLSSNFASSERLRK